MPFLSSDPATRQVQRRWLRWVAVIVGMFVVAGVLAAAGGGSHTIVLTAYAIGGIAAVLAVSGIFYEVGASEDRDRARK
jgi:hypothetical protein